jgi:hypothetical protein
MARGLIEDAKRYDGRVKSSGKVATLEVIGIGLGVVIGVGSLSYMATGKADMGFALGGVAGLGMLSRAFNRYGLHYNLKENIKFRAGAEFAYAASDLMLNVLFETDLISYDAFSTLRSMGNSLGL